MIEEFDKYTKNYDMNVSEIKLKYDHSFRVMEQSISLARFLNLSEEDEYLAKLIGLLHDIGRFEQFKVYKTYNDSISIDHGDYAVDILFNEKLIRNFIADDKFDNIINVAIKNHNKFMIENNLTERELLHSKIIRDADKIDILYNVAYLNYIKINETDDEISKKVKESFYNRETIKHEYSKNGNDRLISFLSFIFDINYNYSMIYIKENKILELIYEKVKNKDKFKEYFDCMIKYVDSSINKCMKEGK